MHQAVRTLAGNRKEVMVVAVTPNGR